MGRKTRSPRKQKLSSGSAKKQVGDDVRRMYEALVEVLCVRFNATCDSRSPLTLLGKDGCLVTPSTLAPLEMREECQSRGVDMEQVLLYPEAWQLLYGS